jgi:hypothetical protein
MKKQEKPTIKFATSKPVSQNKNRKKSHSSRVSSTNKPNKSSNLKLLGRNNLQKNETAKVDNLPVMEPQIMIRKVSNRANLQPVYWD